MGSLKDRIDVQPILPVKVPVTIGTMKNFNADGDGHGIKTSKHSLTHSVKSKSQENDSGKCFRK